MKTFVTSDHHFGHANVIKYSNRPFASVHEMDNHLIDVWNTVVKKDDLVYHLGDFTFGSDYIRFTERLMGNIIFLSNWAHHDKRWLSKIKSLDILHMKQSEFMLNTETLSGGFIKISGQIETIYIHNSWVVMSHFPLAEWERKHYGAYHFHGHSHGNHKATGRIMDVGVDLTAYTPIEIVSAIKLIDMRE